MAPRLALFCILVCLFTTAVFAQWYVSGERFELDGDMYTVQISSNGQTIQLRNEQNRDLSRLVSKGSRTNIGPYSLHFEDSRLQNSSLTPGEQFYQVYLQITKQEPSIITEFHPKKDTLVVGDTLEYELRIAPNGSFRAEDVHVRIPTTQFEVLSVSGCVQNADAITFSQERLSSAQTCRFTVQFFETAHEYELKATLSYKDSYRSYERIIWASRVTVNPALQFEVSLEQEVYVTNMTNITMTAKNYRSSSVKIENITLILPSQLQSTDSSQTQTSQDGQQYFFASRTLQADETHIFEKTVRALQTGEFPIYYQLQYSIDDVVFQTPLQTRYIKVFRPGQQGENLSSVTKDTAFELAITVPDRPLISGSTIEVEADIVSQFVDSIYDADMALLHNGQIIAKRFAEQVDYSHRRRLPTTQVQLSSQNNGTHQLLLQVRYRIDGQYFEQTKEKKITLEQNKPVELEKTVSQEKAAPGQTVQVRVYATPSLSSLNRYVTISESFSSPVQSSGTTRRELFVQNTERQFVYEYEFSMPDLQDENNSLELRTNSEYRIDDQVFASNISQMVQVLASQTHLRVVEVEQSQIRQGDVTTMRFRIQNNASQPVYDLHIRPLSTKAYDTNMDESILISQLDSEQQRSVSFVYRGVLQTNQTQPLLRVTYTDVHGAEHTQYLANISDVRSGGILGPIFTVAYNLVYDPNTEQFTYEYIMQNVGDTRGSLELVTQEQQQTMQLEPNQTSTFEFTSSINESATLFYSYLNQQFMPYVTVQSVQTLPVRQPPANRTSSTQQPTSASPQEQIEESWFSPYHLVFLLPLVLIGLAFYLKITPKKIPRDRSPPGIWDSFRKKQYETQSSTSTLTSTGLRPQDIEQKLSQSRQRLRSLQQALNKGR
ncbi:MAG: hypothetical protein ACMXYF_03940 [Candidatus Woesearchaeota archaeon]